MNVRIPNATTGDGDVVAETLGGFVVSCRDQGDVRVNGFDPVVQYGEPVVVCRREEVLVTKFDVVDLEGLGMTMCGSHRTPVRAAITHAVF